jgi:hypothetical protein
VFVGGGIFVGGMGVAGGSGSDVLHPPSPIKVIVTKAITILHIFRVDVLFVAMGLLRGVR